MRHFYSSKLAVIVFLVLIVGALPLVFPSGYYFRVAALVYISALAAIGLNILMGQAGQVSLGHAGFFGIGAYAMAIGPTHLGLSPWVCVPLGTFLSAAIAFLVGRPILRLKGYYLAIATLGLGALITFVLINENRWTGGPDGMPVPRLQFFGWRLSGSETWYWISGAVMTVGAWFALNVQNSPTGRAFRALHNSEIAARVLGVDVAAFKLKAFVISAVYASVAGSLLACTNGLVTPDSANFLHSVELVTIVVVGGLGSVLGSVVGAAVLITLPQILTLVHEYENLMLGLIIMLAMIFLKRGIVPSLATWLPRGAPG